MRKNLLLLCLILALSPAIHPEDLDDPYLSPERRQEIIRNQEDKWDMDAHPSPSWPAGNGTSHLLKPETVHLRPGQNGTFQLGPLRIIVPPGAFGNQSVEIQVLLLTQPKDFVLAGIPLDFSENGKPGVLISDGMFHLQFLDARGQAIRPVRPLTVEMQPSDPEDMGMYRRDGTSWTRVGSAGIEQRWPEDCDVYRNQNNGQPELILVEESPCGESVAM
ncbi:MAG: hypothetical protein KDK25_11980, partial [Leptospiraceae bacterium]|nr:hypothetical protein [Leptospiraceae bacterium]